MKNKDEIWNLAAKVVESFWRGEEGEELYDKMVELNNFITEHKPELIEPIEDFTVPVTWSVRANIVVRASNLREAEDLAKETFLQHKEGMVGEYMDGTLKAGERSDVE